MTSIPRLHTIAAFLLLSLVLPLALVIAHTPAVGDAPMIQSRARRMSLVAATLKRALTTPRATAL